MEGPRQSQLVMERVKRLRGSGCTHVRYMAYIVWIFMYRAVLCSGLSSLYGTVLKTHVMKKRMRKKRRRRRRRKRERERERDQRCSCLGVRGLYGRGRTRERERREMKQRVMKSLTMLAKR